MSSTKNSTLFPTNNVMLQNNKTIPCTLTQTHNIGLDLVVTGTHILTWRPSREVMLPFTTTINSGLEMIKVQANDDFITFNRHIFFINIMIDLSDTRRGKSFDTFATSVAISNH